MAQQTSDFGGYGLSASRYRAQPGLSGGVPAAATGIEPAGAPAPAPAAPAAQPSLVGDPGPIAGYAESAPSKLSMVQAQPGDFAAIGAAAHENTMRGLEPMGGVAPLTGAANRSKLYSL